jgi:hypothetical protein
MKIWRLTNIGKRLARSTRNPDSPLYKVIHCLDRIGSGTSDQIASFTGMSQAEVNMSLMRLAGSNPPIVGIV